MRSGIAVVTGATGFIGEHLVRRLVQLGTKVRVLVRSNPKLDKFQSSLIEIVVGDLRDKSSMVGLCTDVDMVYHLGSTMAFDLSESALLDINVGGTERLIQLAMEQKVPRFILVSSGGIHSNRSGEPVNEESEVQPENIYLDSKIRAEEIARKLYNENQGRLTIVRPSMVYGPGDWRRLKLYKSVLHGYFIMIGTGRTFIHPVYCEDLVNGLILAAGDKGRGETFILGGPEPITMQNFVNIIARNADKTLLPLKIPEIPIRLAASLCESVCRPFGISPPLSPRRLSFFLKHRIYDISKACRLLDYDPRISLTDGVRRTLIWYNEQGWL